MKTLKLVIKRSFFNKINDSQYSVDLLLSQTVSSRKILNVGYCE